MHDMHDHRQRTVRITTTTMRVSCLQLILPYFHQITNNKTCHHISCRLCDLVSNAPAHHTTGTSVRTRVVEFLEQGYVVVNNTCVGLHILAEYKHSAYVPSTLRPTRHSIVAFPIANCLPTCLLGWLLLGVVPPPPTLHQPTNLHGGVIGTRDQAPSVAGQTHGVDGGTVGVHDAHLLSGVEGPHAGSGVR